MKREYLPEESKPKQGEVGEHNIAADDIKFVRSAIEKAYKQIDPEAHVMIMWGFICTIAYIGIHFLISLSLYEWIPRLYVPLIAAGASYSIFNTIRGLRRARKTGYVPRIGVQLVWTAIIVLIPPVIFDFMGVFKNIFCGPGFVYAWSLGTFLCLGGIFHSKEWLFGGIGIFAGVILAFFIRDYAFIILGLATGLGCIVPAIIARKNYLKTEKGNAQV